MSGPKHALFPGIRSPARAPSAARPALLWYSQGSDGVHWHAVPRGEARALCGERIVTTLWHCYATSPSTSAGATICDDCARAAAAPGVAGPDIAAQLGAAHARRALVAGGRRSKGGRR